MDKNQSHELYQSDSELFDFQLYHNSSHERGFLHSGRVGIIICVCNLLINCLIVVLVGVSRTTRKQYVILQITNIAVIDILTSILVDILTIYYNIYPWTLGQVLCEMWLILDVVMPFCALLAIIFLNMDRIMFAVNPSLYYNIFKKTYLRWIYLLAPWVLSCALIVPIWLGSNVPMQPIVFMCVYAVTEEAGLASSILSLFIPSIIIIALTICVLLMIANGLPKSLPDFHGLSFDDYRTNSRTVIRRHNSVVVALCMVNIATLIMQLPFGAISIMEPQCLADPCTSIIDLMLALSWLRSATPGVRGLIWFLFTEIKFSCCLCVRTQSRNRNRSLVENVPMTSSIHTQHDHLISVASAAADKV